MKREYPRYGSRTANLEQNMSVADAAVLEQFLAVCAMTGGARTLYKHRRNLLHFRDIVEKPFAEISRDDVIVFWGLVRNSPYSAPTKISVQKTVRRFLKWYKNDPAFVEGLRIEKHKYDQQKLNSAALFAQDELPKLIQVADRIKLNSAALFAQDELPKLIQVADRIKDKSLISMIRDTSSRPDEVRHTLWKHLLFDRKAVWVYSHKTKSGRLLPLRLQTIEYLKEWQAAWPFSEQMPEDFVFPSGSLGKEMRVKPISVEAINKTVKRLAQRAGLKREVWTYLMRHTQLTRAWKQGIQGVEHDYYAGHVPGSDQQSVYVHLSEDELCERLRGHLFSEEEGDDDTTKPVKDRIAALEGQNRQMRSQLDEVVVFLHEVRAAMQKAKSQLA